MWRAGALAAVAAAWLVACGGGSDTDRRDTRPDAQASRGGTLEVLSSSDADSLDPARAYAFGAWAILMQVHRPLYAFTEGREPVPDLAAGPPQISADGRTVTVRIRGGVRFGAPVDREVVAADVRNAIERGFRPSVVSPYAESYFGDLEGVEAFRSGRAEHIAGIELPDDRTLRFRLARPRAALLVNALALLITAPVPSEVSRAADRGRTSTYDRRAVPTGPYRITAYKPGVRIELERNAGHSSQGDFRRALPDRIVWRVRSDIAVASRQVLQGRGRLLGFGPPPPAGILRDVARGRYAGRTGAVQASGTLVYSLDTSRPPLDDVNVRRAILAGADRRALQLSQGGEVAGEIATHYLPPTIPGWEEAGGAAGPGVDFLRRPEGDPKLAASYLRKAGFPSGRFDGPSVELLSVVGLSTGEVLQQQLEKLGFRVKLRNLNPDALFSRCGSPGRKPHICIGPWAADFFDGEAFLGPVLDPASINPEFTLNMSALRDERLARAFDAARLKVDPAERARAWGQVDRTATELAPALPVVWGGRSTLLRSRDVRAGVSEWLGWWDLSSAGLVRTP